jgi:phage tail tape-measure protein
MSNLNLKAVFTLLDRVSGPLKKVSAATKGVGDVFKRTGSLASGMSARLNVTKTAFEGVRQSADGAAKSSGLLGTAIGATIGVGLAALIKGVFSTTAQFERFETILGTIEGSSSKAKQSMDWIEVFAAKTPYQLAEVTDAFVKMRSYGMDPMDGSLRTLGDTAAAMGKPLIQAIEALADAQTGEFERLKEFGVRASVIGKQVRFTYQKDGKDMVISTKKNASDMRKALINIFDNRAAGAMDKLATTWDGLWSNLMDTVASIQKKVGQAGIFDLVKNDLSGFLKWFSDAKNKTQVDKWAKGISDSLSEVYKVLKSIDWTAVLKDITSIIKGISDLIANLGGFKVIVDIGIAVWIASLMMGLTGLIAPLTAVVGLIGGAGAAAAIAAWPITAIIAIIAGLAALAYLVWRNWDWFVAKWSELWGSVQKTVEAVGAFLSKWCLEKPKELWNLLPEWFRNLISGAVSMSPIGFAVKGISSLMAEGKPSGPPRPGVGGGGPKGAIVGGEIKVTVDDKRTRVTEVKSSSKAVPLTANTGLQGAF